MEMFSNCEFRIGDVAADEGAVLHERDPDFRSVGHGSATLRRRRRRSDCQRLIHMFRPSLPGRVPNSASGELAGLN